MWFVERSYRFEASHRLLRSGDKRVRMHGHSWRAYVMLASSALGTGGEAVCAGLADAAMGVILEHNLDYHHLNESMNLENPTAEELARWVYEYLKPLVPGLWAVRIEGSCSESCSYTPA